MKKVKYDPKKFCIPVTKTEPRDSIQFIIDDFIEKGLSFCVDGSGNRWEIWRAAEEDDRDEIKKKGAPLRPKELYVEGERVEIDLSDIEDIADSDSEEE